MGNFVDREGEKKHTGKWQQHTDNKEENSWFQDGEAPTLPPEEHSEDKSSPGAQSSNFNTHVPPAPHLPATTLSAGAGGRPGVGQSVKNAASRVVQGVQAAAEAGYTVLQSSTPMPPNTEASSQGHRGPGTVAGKKPAAA